MALSNLQKLTILKHIGLPLRTIDSTKTDYSNIIADRLNSVTEDEQVLIEDVLVRLDGTQIRLSKAVSRSGIKRIDDIEFFGGENGRSEFEVLRDEHRGLVRELADCLNLRGYVRSSNQVSVCVG